ncbi:hypothetical protein [Ramlibacter sp. 2FC]|nr:hypothetical protein [Ramlibacter sp. 2FC]
MTKTAEERDAYFGEPYARITADIGPLITTAGLELHALAWAISQR